VTQCVILAGGLGTRIRAVDPTRPKAMLPVAGRPFIEHQLDLLKRCGMRDVVLCIGHQGDQIERHVGDGARFGMAVRYAHEEPDRLMGTGGALLNALPLLREEFLVMYGDSYLPVDYAAVAAAFARLNAPALMTVYRNEGRWDKSNVRIDKDRVVFYSKAARPGEADYIDYGLTMYRRSVIGAYRDRPMPLDMAKVLEDLVARGELAAFEVHQRFYEVGKPEGLAELDAFLRQAPHEKSGFC
jgi:NDP-sugar pyrophosphorylase family protein